MAMKEKVKGGMIFLIAFIMFAALLAHKLTVAPEASWWLVTAPLWVLLAIILIAGLILLTVEWAKRKIIEEKKNERSK